MPLTAPPTRGLPPPSAGPPIRCIDTVAFWLVRRYLNPTTRHYSHPRTLLTVVKMTVVGVEGSVARLVSRCLWPVLITFSLGSRMPVLRQNDRLGLPTIHCYQ